tara:strand:+ start:573 stop:797 length:225 start_codon:yes stop_codon:yes gene_type:complete
MFTLSLIVAIFTFIFSLGYSYILNEPNKKNYRFHLKHTLLTFVTVYLGQLFVGSSGNTKSGYLKQIIKTGSPDF